MPDIRDSLRNASAPSLMLMRAAEAEIYKLDAEVARLRRGGLNDGGPDFTDTSRAALCWLLWHHQAERDPVGTVVRYILGMGANEAMSERQLAAARTWGPLLDNATGSPGDEEIPASFLEEFARNYYGTVHIADPAWHAKRIWRSAMWCLLTSADPLPRPLMWTRRLPGFMRETSVVQPLTPDWTALYPLRELIKVAALQMYGEDQTDELTVSMAAASEAVVREKARLQMQAGHSYRGCWSPEVEVVVQMAEYYYVKGWQSAERFHDIGEEITA